MKRVLSDTSLCDFWLHTLPWPSLHLLFTFFFPSPHPSPYFDLVNCPTPSDSPHLLIPVPISPSLFDCNPSSLCVYMRCAYLGGFMHQVFLSCITVCNHKLWLNHYANADHISADFQSGFVLNGKFLTLVTSLFPCCSTTTRAVTSVTSRLTFLWCGTATLSSTTPSTFKVGLSPLSQLLLAAETWAHFSLL